MHTNLVHNNRIPRRKALARKPVLLCLSHLRWNFVWQRPQQLMSRAVKDFDVVFFEEPIAEQGTAPRLEMRTDSSGVIVCAPVVPAGWSGARVDMLQRKLLDELLAGFSGAALATWYYTPMALKFSRHLTPRVCIYDNMDELSAFAGAPSDVRSLEQELFDRCDVVFTGGFSLYQAKRHRHANIHAFPSSIDAKHFCRARARAIAPPADQAHLACPRVGFFGVIDERMNLDLVDAIAAQRPAWSVVMIGPVAKIDPASLPRRSNIHWLGPKRYAELPDYLSGWDAGLMPFAINEATRFISPTKTPEFLAAGVPVVSTPIADVVRPYAKKGLVEIASTPQDFIEKLEQWAARPKDDWLRAVDRHLATMSWDATWAAMKDHIETRPNTKAAPGRATSEEGALV